MNDNTISITISNGAEESLVRQWLLRHLKYATDGMVNHIHPEDKEDAQRDADAFRRILDYVGCYDD